MARMVAGAVSEAMNSEGVAFGIPGAALRPLYDLSAKAAVPAK